MIDVERPLDGQQMQDLL